MPHVRRASRCGRLCSDRSTPSRVRRCCAARMARRLSSRGSSTCWATTMMLPPLVLPGRLSFGPSRPWCSCSGRCGGRRGRCRRERRGAALDGKAERCEYGIIPRLPNPPLCHFRTLRGLPLCPRGRPLAQRCMSGVTHGRDSPTAAKMELSATDAAKMELAASAGGLNSCSAALAANNSIFAALGEGGAAENSIFAALRSVTPDLQRSPCLGSRFAALGVGTSLITPDLLRWARGGFQ